MKNHIAELLRGGGRSQKWLADETGFNPSYISLLISGQKSPSPDAMERIALAFGRALGDVFEVEGFAGFDESQAEPFQPGPRADPVSRAIDALKSGLRKAQVWRSRVQDAGLSIQVGDLLVLETQPPFADGTVLVTVADPDTGDAHTELRRLHGRHLIASSPQASQPVLDAQTDQSTGILGRVSHVLHLA